MFVKRLLYHGVDILDCAVKNGVDIFGSAAGRFLDVFEDDTVSWSRYFWIAREHEDSAFSWC